ncbi:MAG: tyrosine-type recombinase/integrase [Oscillospiraceae bacterium]|nr:tyrosine-type recombinase/integrase [Oscillospiraceae bacterium]
MTAEQREQCPDVLKKFLTYHETIAGHSSKTIDEYFLDMRLFFRFLNLSRGIVSAVPFDEIPIKNVDITFLEKVTLDEVYEYLNFLSRERPKQKNSPKTAYGLEASARARKIACIRSFFKYITSKTHQTDKNPVVDIESPRQRKALPQYLTLDESLGLLESVQGRHETRDYAILTIFLNCGLRRSELAGLNLSNLKEDKIRILGKGNKERDLFLNEACLTALRNYLDVRPDIAGETALFLSGQNKRMHTNTIHALVKKHLLAAGLDVTRYSSHKLRHTAATLMLSNGVDVRTLQQILGHDHLNTTQIYTHVDNSELRLAARANPLSRAKKKR